MTNAIKKKKNYEKADSIRGVGGLRFLFLVTVQTDSNKPTSQLQFFRDDKIALANDMLCA
jgi:hypothetical protein